MSPGDKRNRGMGVVGYLRVSSRGQVDGWPLEQQEQVIRNWAEQHGLPIIAIERSADGWESGATGFGQRDGWQAVEAHLATGNVGWIAVAAVDRLSRDFLNIAEQLHRWIEQDIAIGAPGQGFASLEGIGPFLMQLLGLLSEQERTRLISRVIPGMIPRMEHGLPLGTQPWGYVVQDVSAGYLSPRGTQGTPLASGRSPGPHDRLLVPDPATTPIIQELFRYAESHPQWGDRRLAAWATRQWPEHYFSHGRILPGFLPTSSTPGPFVERSVIGRSFCSAITRIWSIRRSSLRCSDNGHNAPRIAPRDMLLSRGTVFLGDLPAVWPEAAPFSGGVRLRPAWGSSLGTAPGTSVLEDLITKEARGYEDGGSPDVGGPGSGVLRTLSIRPAPQCSPVPSR